jgi:hypothetical protein
MVLEFLLVAMMEYLSNRDRTPKKLYIILEWKYLKKIFNIAQFTSFSSLFKSIFNELIHNSYSYCFALVEKIFNF